MLFNSWQFLALFLPVYFAALYLFKKLPGASAQALMSCIIALSLVFYSYSEGLLLGLLLLSIAVNYGFGLVLLQNRSKKILWLCIVANLGLLAWFKYYNFFVENINQVLQLEIAENNMVLPLAISFFTFQQIAYNVDIYNKKITSGRFVDYLFFVSFFPQLIAGPIVRYQEIIPQTGKQWLSRISLEVFSIGLLIFFIGLFKKVVIADTFAEVSDFAFYEASVRESISSFHAWLACLSFTFQIYFDFSAYSTMALGLAKMAGLDLPINFYSPYKSASVQEFWRRWHITLSSFLRDYIYIPLGGSKAGFYRKIFALFVVFSLGGLWHGAAWTFVAWGIFHVVYLFIFHAWTAKRPENFAVPRFLAIFLTFFAVALSWVVFRAENIDEAWKILTAMFAMDFSVGNLPEKFSALHATVYHQFRPFFDPGVLVYWSILVFPAFFICLLLPSTEQFFYRELGAGQQKMLFTGENHKLAWNSSWWQWFVILLIALLSVLFMGGLNEFIYFRF